MSMTLCFECFWWHGFSLVELMFWGERLIPNGQHFLPPPLPLGAGLDLPMSLTPFLRYSSKNKLLWTNFTLPLGPLMMSTLNDAESGMFGKEISLIIRTQAGFGVRYTLGR